MADLHKTTAITIYTTPNELRKLASQLERAWASVEIGDAAPQVIWIGSDVSVAFIIDQSKMSK